MLFWVVAGAMVAASAAVLVWTLVRPAAGGSDAAPHPDFGIYRAQLDGVDRDLARGVIGPAEAEPIRTEISRRILDLDRQIRATGDSAGKDGGRGLPVAGIALVLAGALGLYAWLGAPGYPDLPHSQRIANAEALRTERPPQALAEADAAKARPAPPAPSKEFAALMDKLRAAVAKRPDDVTGLQLLARNERALGNLSAAAAAQAQLVKALGDRASPDDLAALADNYVNAAGGIVTPEAEATIVETLRRDPTNGTARFYAGLLEAQTGRPDHAFALWRDLLEHGPQDAPWVPFIRDQIVFLGAAAGVDYTPPAAVKGPDAATVAAAGQMNAADRTQMIEGMVAGLEGRLMAQGGTAAEWTQLVTALGVLGATDRAKAAWAKAQTALAADAAGLDQVRTAARQAGVAP